MEQRLKQALSILERGLIERGPEARLVLLAACCGEHLLLIGPPGTAKSEVARRLGRLVVCFISVIQRNISDSFNHINFFVSLFLSFSLALVCFV